MVELHVGDWVTLPDGRAYFVRGLAPMSVAQRRVQLEDTETGERTEIPVDDLLPQTRTQATNNAPTQD